MMPTYNRYALVSAHVKCLQCMLVWDVISFRYYTVLLCSQNCTLSPWVPPEPIVKSISPSVFWCHPRPAGPLDFPLPAGGGGAFKRPPPSRRWKIQRPSRARVKPRQVFEYSAESAVLVREETGAAGMRIQSRSCRRRHILPGVGAAGVFAWSRSRNRQKRGGSSSEKDNTLWQIIKQ